MKRTNIYMTWMLWAVCVTATAQPYYTGLKRDRVAEAAVPEKAMLLTRSYELLPKRHVLVQHCPMPMNQGQHGTCTSWASAYAARTIAEAVNKKWTDTNLITRNAFSPPFVYKSIKDASDRDCQVGSSIPAALRLMKEHGVPRFSDFNVECADVIPETIYERAASNKIDNYSTLFRADASDEKKINMVKKSISQNCPVIIGMDVYQSFYHAHECWDGRREGVPGYHAMCIVGYDDERHGGAFLLMNSWGTDWGIKGFTWVRYADFCAATDYAADLYVKPQEEHVQPKPVPTPQPIPDKQLVLPQPTLTKHRLAGAFHLQLATGEKLEVTRANTPLPHYKVKDELVSGTRYRLYVSNNAPAYVYIIGSDLQNNVSRVFPPTDNISPALTYSSNDIAIPDEKWYIQMDNTVGKDYVCVLFSAYELPISDIVKALQLAPGSFYEKVQKVLGNSRVPNKDMKVSDKEVRFQATTNGIIIPLIVEVTHI